MRSLEDVESDIGDVKEKIQVNEKKLDEATAEKHVDFYQNILTQLNAQLTELLKERNNLGTIPTISCSQ